MQQVIFDHSEQAKTLFVIVMAAIDPFNGKTIFKSAASSFETDPVIRPVAGRLVIVPLKTNVSHHIRLTRSFVNFPEACSKFRIGK